VIALKKEVVVVFESFKVFLMNKLKFIFVKYARWEGRLLGSKLGARDRNAVDCGIDDTSLFSLLHMKSKIRGVEGSRNYEMRAGGGTDKKV
jgi:hypothetical protein